MISLAAYRDPPSHLSPLQVERYRAQARSCAAKTAERARAVGLLDKDVDGRCQMERFTPGQLLEIAACVQIEEWELSGFSSLLGDKVPSAAEAWQDVLDRVRQGPSAFETYDGLRLCFAVVGVWQDKLSLESPDVIGAELAVSDIDEDFAIEVLAQLLWAHRNSLNGENPASAGDPDEAT